MTNKTEQEIPLHKRKKGKKLFILESRLTPEGAQRLRDKLEDEIKRGMHWSNWWNKYEKLKDAEQALDDINKKKKRSLAWQTYLKDREYRIKQ